MKKTVNLANWSGEEEEVEYTEHPNGDITFSRNDYDFKMVFDEAFFNKTGDKQYKLEVNGEERDIYTTEYQNHFEAYVLGVGSTISRDSEDALSCTYQLISNII